MSVRVRLTRVGSKKNAIWRVVVADRRSPRDGRFIEMIGHYNPQTQPSQIVIDKERLQHWLDLGAEPSNTVKKLMRAQPSGATAASDADEPAAAVEPETGPEAEHGGADGPPPDAEPAAEAQPVEEADSAAADEPAAEGEQESG